MKNYMFQSKIKHKEHPDSQNTSVSGVGNIIILQKSETFHHTEFKGEKMTCPTL